MELLKAPFIEYSDDIEIKVTPMYLSEFSVPENKEYAFLYKVEIQNSFADDIQLISKEVTIRDGNRDEYTLEFEDVNDEQVCLPAGELYEYSTYCPLETQTGNLRGFILARNMRTNEFFELDLPLVFFKSNIEVNDVNIINYYDLPITISM